METITPAFAKSFQNCRFLDDNLGDAMDKLDHEITGLNFLLVDHRNPWFKELLRTETTKNMNEIYEEKEDNKGKKTKLLIIHGE